MLIQHNSQVQSGNYGVYKLTIVQLMIISSQVEVSR
jgi:hypothetical protein